jgi:hypothetical protein
MLIACDSRWADERVIAWGVEEYPDLESQQKVTEVQAKLGWYRYFITKSILGTKMED